MDDHPSLREWLGHYGDWLGASELIALMVGSVIGFMQRAKGVTLFITHVAAAVSALVLFSLGVSYGYGVILVAVASGTVGGALGMALFRLLISVSDRLDARRNEIADRIIDKVPLSGKEHET